MGVWKGVQMEVQKGIQMGSRRGPDEVQKGIQIGGSTFCTYPPATSNTPAISCNILCWWEECDA